MIFKKTSRAVMLCGLLLFTSQVFASFDEESCNWVAEDCLLFSPPELVPGNDTRDNLLRILSAEKSFALPLQNFNVDISRTRDVYFDFHSEYIPLYDPEKDQVQSSAKVAPPDDSSRQSEAEIRLPAELERLMAELGIDANQFKTPEAVERKREAERGMENRFVSYTLDAVTQFNKAVIADNTLTRDQKHDLVLARIKLFYGSNLSELTPLLGGLPADSNAIWFRGYLSGVANFYDGNYDAARETFQLLVASKQAWLAETAQYMLMRTALNKSVQDIHSEYGEFDPANVNREEALLAQKAANIYLQEWPKGLYADSARGMLRRISWYLQEWPQLAVTYEKALLNANNISEVRRLVSEYDSSVGNYSYLDSSPKVYSDAPLISYIEQLRQLRINGITKRFDLTQAQLNSSKYIFEQSGKMALWRNLQLQFWRAAKNNQVILDTVIPARVLPAHDILAFTEQIIYGDALMAQEKWSEAENFWRQLLRLSQDKEQQSYIQTKLATTLVDKGDIAGIFAPDSGVTNLRFRSQVLKAEASMDLLRKQALNAPHNEERTIALHTLLTRDLTENQFGDWLIDRLFVNTHTRPIKSEAFADVRLDDFNWNGEQAEAGYSCAILDETIKTLSENPKDAHALNCLGEFFRTTRTHIDIDYDHSGNGDLGEVIGSYLNRGQFDRQSYYQTIIASPKAKPEDKSFALYRAIKCYAPSGENDCGGQEVSKQQRKNWYMKLKSQFPGSLWAKKLKYYW